MKKLIGFIFIVFGWQSAFSVLNQSEEHQAWQFIRANFMGESNHPIIYVSDIAIKLEGNYSKSDSVLLTELVTDLKTIIPNKKIYMTTGDANLVFNFMNYKHGAGQLLKGSRTGGKSIIYKNIEVSFHPEDSTVQTRKEILYYCLYRSLVQFSSPSTEPRYPIRYQGYDPTLTHCVFYEKKPGNLTYSYYDSFILGNLYAPDFKDRFKKDFLKDNSYRQYLLEMYSPALNICFYFVEFLIIFTLLFVFIVMGRFNSHNWSRREFNKQGFLLIICGGVYMFGYLLSDLTIYTWKLIAIINYTLLAIISVNVIYYIEKKTIINYNVGGSKVLIIFLITFIVLNLFSVVSAISLNYFIDLILLSNQYQSGILQKSSAYLDNFEFTKYITFSGPLILIPSIGRSLFIFFNDRYKSIINEKDVQLAKVSELRKQAELQSLQSKINPHFLYNALNSIASLSSTDSGKTEKMALSLSDFFKYSINREHKQFNSLSEELNAIRTYLEIEKVRFGDRLSFEIDCAPELLDVQIPQILIQPLVENAFKHGLSQITEKGLIKITVSKEENQLKIKVYDNGPAFPEGPLSGYGIQNTQERISLIYVGKASINWYNGRDKYIELDLPFKLG